MSRHGLTLAEVLVVAVILIVVALIATPTYTCCGQRASNERNAMTSLKTLTSAEADFRLNDRDGNHVNDFWTANVSGLYTMTSAYVRGAEANSTTDPSIKLIEQSVALGDVDGEFVSAGGENVPISSFGPACAKAGYWYAALNADLSVGKGPEGAYRQDTKGTPPMGRVHHLSRFGFVALPDSTSSGKYAFLVNENNSVFRSAISAPWRQATETPPGIRNVSSAYLCWPDDPNLKAYWSTLD